MCVCVCMLNHSHYKGLIFTGQLHNCWGPQVNRMDHSSKQCIEESRLRKEDLYESLLRLEDLFADVQSGKTYHYI